jgi:hypothetical protein
MTIRNFVCPETEETCQTGTCRRGGFCQARTDRISRERARELVLEAERAAKVIVKLNADGTKTIVVPWTAEELGL